VNIHRLSDIRVRDPFILPDPATQTYYLCVALRPSEGHPRPGVGVYTSPDLETWQGPHTVFEIPEGFWAQAGIWAPELHAYREKFYLFLTFNTTDPFLEQWPDWLPRVRRGTQVLWADSPLGPFRPFHNRAHTPADMMALDGTLWVEEDVPGHEDVPYLVYCHEWVEIVDGTVELVRLKDDLSYVVGEPVVLFRGSDAPWGRPLMRRHDGYVTDGPFLYRTRTGRLLMIWSSFGAGGYTTGLAVSQSGSVRGPWVQTPAPLFAGDGGHGMLFTRFDGTLMLTLHQPNKSPEERARLFKIEDVGDRVRLMGRDTDTG
jgi:hypothetical protein